MEKQILELQVHDKVVIEDRFTGQSEEKILKVYGYGTKNSFYETENFMFNIYSAGRISIHHKKLDKDQNIDYDFKIVEAKRPVNVIENDTNKIIDVTFWKDGKYIDLIDLSEYGEYLQVVKEDVYKRKYEELVRLLSYAKKQVSLDCVNHVQSLILDFSDMNPTTQQEIYELIVKEK